MEEIQKNSQQNALEEQIATLTEALTKISNASYGELRPIVERYRLNSDVKSLICPDWKEIYRPYATDDEWELTRKVAGYFQQIAFAAIHGNKK